MRRSVVAFGLVLWACSSGKEGAAPAPTPPAVMPAAVAVLPSAGGGGKEIAITSVSPGAVDAFRKARELYENALDVECVEQLMRALELDPDLAEAHAYLALETTGPRAAHHVEEAARLAAALPDAERLSVERIVAQQRGEDEKKRSLSRKLAEAAPGDWRAQFQQGSQLFDERKWDEAAAVLRRVTELAPEAGPPRNMLAYTLLFSGKADEAVTSFRRYVELKPADANPHDSLGEALMAAGKLAEAEASFKKATDLSPDFWSGWEGVAESRFLRGDWVGGREALARARAAAGRPFDKLETDRILAWSYLAEGKTAEARKTADALEREGEAQETGDWWKASPSLLRAAVLTEEGKHAEALKQVATAMERSTNLLGVQLNDIHRQALAWRVWNEARLGKAADASKTTAQIEELAKKAPGNALLGSELHFARGASLWARGDFKGAAHEMGQCVDEDYYCRYQAVLALDKAGDPGATAARAQLLGARRRDAVYVFAWARLSAKK